MKIENLESLSKWYGNIELDFDRELIHYRYSAIKKYFVGKTCLEIAPAQGVMTKELIGDFETLYAVDGSKNLLNQIPNYPNVFKYHSMIEDFNIDIKFDTIIMDHVLEHIEHPRIVLEKIKSLMHLNSNLIIGVPNALSFHRLLGVEMGNLNTPYELNIRDIELGHFRVYDLNSLTDEVKNAGYDVFTTDGVFLKFLSNSQIQKSFDNKMKDGCFSLGTKFKENCAEIYVICKLKN